MTKSSEQNDKVGMKTMDDAEVEAIRTALNTAMHLLTPKGFQKLAERLGVQASNWDTWTKGRHEAKGKDVKFTKDRAILKRFLFETELGRLISSSGNNENSSFNPLDNNLFISRLLESARFPEAGSNQLKPDGVYQVLHGSYILPDHFVVRLMRVFRSATGHTLVEDTIFDEKTVNQGQINAPGVLIYKSKYPQIVTMRDDNAEGLSIFIAELAHPTKDLHIDYMYGSIFGYSRKKMLFERVAKIKRLPSGSSDQWNSLVAMTGIRPLDEWSKEIQDEFRSLASRVKEERQIDPVLSLSPSCKG